MCAHWSNQPAEQPSVSTYPKWRTPPRCKSSWGSGDTTVTQWLSSFFAHLSIVIFSPRAVHSSVANLFYLFSQLTCSSYHQDVERDGSLHGGLSHHHRHDALSAPSMPTVTTATKKQPQRTEKSCVIITSAAFRLRLTLYALIVLECF